MSITGCVGRREQRRRWRPVWGAAKGDHDSIASTFLGLIECFVSGLHELFDAQYRRTQIESGALLEGARVPLLGRVPSPSPGSGPGFRLRAPTPVTHPTFP